MGQVFRSRIRERTFKGLDANGTPFTPYSTRGPYYLYPNRESGALRGVKATAATRQARATAARNRQKKTGGQRTPYGIRYDSYAAAKAAHGVANVNLYGMEQHTHMLDTMLVKVGGMEAAQSFEGADFGSEFAAFEGNTAAQELTLGFYGPEAERAKGQNEGNRKTPQREFFALNGEDLKLAEKAIGERMIARAQVKSGVTPSRPAPMPTGDDIGF